MSMPLLSTLNGFGINRTPLYSCKRMLGIIEQQRLREQSPKDGHLRWEKSATGRYDAQRRERETHGSESSMEVHRVTLVQHFFFSLLDGPSSLSTQVNLTALCTTWGSSSSF